MTGREFRSPEDKCLKKIPLHPADDLKTTLTLPSICIINTWCVCTVVQTLKGTSHVFSSGNIYVTTVMLFLPFYVAITGN
jgi:hypothetical protein